MLKVFLQAPAHLSRGIHRVSKALTAAAPADVELVATREESELVIYHVIGLTGLRELIAEDTRAGRRFAILQYCLRTTEDARPEVWLPIWQGAAAVWSYYDLAVWTREELAKRGDVPAYSESGRPRHYYAPLGVDAGVFRPAAPARKRFVIGTSGFVAETEGVRECYEAARRVDREQFHLGPNLNLGPGVTYMLGVSDADVAEMWSACTFVAGLRRIEGFELPVLEALACGSRPIVFDAPHYRHWFGEHAEYVPEASTAEVADALEAIMRRPARIVTPAERAAVVERFDWRRLAGGFWEAIV